MAEKSKPLEYVLQVTQTAKDKKRIMRKLPGKKYDRSGGHSTGVKY